MLAGAKWDEPFRQSDPLSDLLDADAMHRRLAAALASGHFGEAEIAPACD